MILQLGKSFPADAVEIELPDADAAGRLLAQHRPDFEALLATRRARLLDVFGAALEARLGCAERALRLSLARFGRRHGSWSADFHHYHNENHALEILCGRIDRLIEQAGLQRMDGNDWLALQLFASCHDLRQRESVDFSHAVGNNEAASIAETFRILDTCGFDRERERGLYLALELMIAGSTFDARPSAPAPAEEYNTADSVASGGALACRLPRFLDVEYPHWRADADIVRATELALIASDLDTANVGEPFVWLAESAARLCQEREMRSGRALDSPESAAPCTEFLSDGQERYFFDLHKFCSPLGEQTFAARKHDNAARVHDCAAHLREHFANGGARARSGREVLGAFAQLALA